jgi:hypothetical protein
MLTDTWPVTRFTEPVGSPKRGTNPLPKAIASPSLFVIGVEHQLPILTVPTSKSMVSALWIGVLGHHRRLRRVCIVPAAGPL